MATLNADIFELQMVIDEMRENLNQRIVAEGFDSKIISYSALADIRYLGQSSELMVPLKKLTVNEEILRSAEEVFEHEYDRLFGHRAERKQFELVNIHIIATVARGVGHV